MISQKNKELGERIVQYNIQMGCGNAWVHNTSYYITKEV